MRELRSNSRGASRALERSPREKAPRMLEMEEPMILPSAREVRPLARQAMTTASCGGAVRRGSAGMSRVDGVGSRIYLLPLPAGCEQPDDRLGHARPAGHDGRVVDELVGAGLEKEERRDEDGGVVRHRAGVGHGGGRQVSRWVGINEDKEKRTDRVKKKNEDTHSRDQGGTDLIECDI